MINVLILLGVYIGVGLLLTFRFVPSEINWQKRIGECFFLTVFLIVIINNVAQFFDINISQKYFFFSFVFISIIGFFMNTWRLLKKHSDTELINYFKNFDKFHYLILSIILIHMYFILEQNRLLPLTPWDAWSAWVAKSKIWHEFGINQLIVNQTNWFEIIGSMTNQAEHYPDGLSLLYTFNAGFFGWNETVLNSLYPAMFIALLLLFYGNIKILINEFYAQLSLIVLLTLPFVNVHIVLAGYADIWVATFIFMAFVNFQQYNSKKNLYCLMLVWINLLLMIMFKQEALIWMCIILSTFVLISFNKFTRRKIYLSIITLTVIWYFLGGFKFELPFGEVAITPELIIIPGLGKFNLSFVNTMSSWFEALFFSKNWHLLWYSLPIVSLLYFRVNNKSILALPLLFLVQAVLFLFVIFSMSYATIFASSFTSINRLVLHIVPTYIYFLFYVIYLFQIQKKSITGQAKSYK